MIKVTLSRENADAEGVAYRAVTAHNQAVGRTAGEAIDALTTQLPPRTRVRSFIVRALVPDRYFTSEQMQRLQQLMGEWRSARDQGRALSADDQSELENLIEIEVRAATERANEAIHEASAVSVLYRHVAERAGHRCEYCRAPEAIFNLPFEVEHIIPTSRSGSDEETNRELACRARDLFKSNQLDGFDEVEGKSVRLHHPRQDSWNVHFRVDEASGTIVGLTSTARATITVLQMNHPNQLAARQRWMLLRLYP